MPFEFLESFRCSIFNVSICDGLLKVMVFEFLESFRCSILSVSICDAPVSDIRVKSYDHLNFLRDSVVQFRASGYVMHLNQTSDWKVMTIYHCSILSVWICDAPESDIRQKSYDHWNFSRASVIQFRASRYVMCLNRTSEWKVMTIWISRELSLFNFEVSTNYAPESDIHLNSLDHLNFSRASVVQFRASQHIMRPNRTSV